MSTMLLHLKRWQSILTICISILLLTVLAVFLWYWIPLWNTKPTESLIPTSQVQQGKPFVAEEFDFTVWYEPQVYSVKEYDLENGISLNFIKPNDFSPLLMMDAPSFYPTFRLRVTPLEDAFSYRLAPLDQNWIFHQLDLQGHRAYLTTGVTVDYLDVWFDTEPVGYHFGDYAAVVDLGDHVMKITVDPERASLQDLVNFLYSIEFTD